MFIKKGKNLFEEGIAMISVLLLTVLLTLMTVSMLFINTNHLSMVGNIEGKEKALKAAEAGVEYAMHMLNEDPAWGLTGDPVFPGGKIVIPGDPNTFPRFTLLNSDSIPVSYTKDCRFTITFNQTSPYRSVNNLFNPLTGEGNTPPYTAKIISIGRFGPNSEQKNNKNY